jgi:hypothetical protein
MRAVNSFKSPHRTCPEAYQVAFPPSFLNSIEADIPEIYIGGIEQSQPRSRFEDMLSMFEPG